MSDYLTAWAACPSSATSIPTSHLSKTIYCRSKNTRWKICINFRKWLALLNSPGMKKELCSLQQSLSDTNAVPTSPSPSPSLDLALLSTPFTTSFAQKFCLSFRPLTRPTFRHKTMSKVASSIPASGRPFGGQYVPESLVESLDALQDAFELHWNDVNFRDEFYSYLGEMRPPSQLQLARRLTKVVNGAQIYIKRDDSNSTGSHSIINALGQALLARRLGKTKVLAETGSGGHGVATAIVCEKLGLECVVYMGVRDARARSDQVKQMKAHGATVIEVSSGGGTIREAITDLLRAAVEEYETAYPLLGGPYGPRPIPMIAKTFQAVAGAELKVQMISMRGCNPNAVVSCAGIHSPAVGSFDAFVQNSDVKLIAVEGAGRGSDSSLHAAVLTNGSPGVYHGAHTLILQDIDGQIEDVHSIAPDLCYPGASPLLAKWKYDGRVETAAITDDEALFGCAIFSKCEGIDCSIEDGHAVAAAVELAASMNRGESIVICMGG